MCPPGVGDPEFDDVANPDPQCTNRPWKHREASSCGLGVELGLLLPMLGWLRRRPLQGALRVI